MTGALFQPPPGVLRYGTAASQHAYARLSDSCALAAPNPDTGPSGAAFDPLPYIRDTQFYDHHLHVFAAVKNLHELCAAAEQWYWVDSHDGAMMAMVIALAGGFGGAFWLTLFLLKRRYPRFAKWLLGTPYSR